MKGKSGSIRRKLLPAGTFVLIILLWWALSATGLIPAYMLPSPADVVSAFIRDFPNLMSHALVSLQEAIYGLLIGTILAFGLACAMDRFLVLEQSVMPLLVVTQMLWFLSSAIPQTLLLQRPCFSVR